MKYNELTISRSKRPNRVGRGISAGQGKTAGRGTKGQNARTGGGVKPGFEGGQNPIMKRLPKLRGFTSFQKPTENIKTGQLDIVKLKLVDNFTLFEAGLISSPYVKVKLISKGEVTGKYSIKLQGASSSAIEMVKSAGGDFTVTDLPKRTKKSDK